MRALQKTGFIWMDGGFARWDDSKAHVLSHGLNYGTGVFEGIRCYRTPRGPAIFRLSEHMARLLESSRIMKFNAKFTQTSYEKACVQVVKKNNLDECYLRVVMFLGYGGLGLESTSIPLSTFIAAWPEHDYLGALAASNGIRVKTSAYRRVFASAGLAGAKITGNYFNSMLAKTEARQAGFDEALMLDAQGLVCECAVENIFMVRKGRNKGPKLITPPTISALPGITRASVMEIAEDEGIGVAEEKFTLEQLCACDEVFITGTSAEVTPVVQVDGKKIGNGCPGTVTKKLQGIYFDAVRGMEKKYKKWLRMV